MTDKQRLIRYPYTLADIAWLMGTYDGLKENKAAPVLMSIYRDSTPELLSKATEVFSAKDRDLYPQRYLQFVAMVMYFGESVQPQQILQMMDLWDRLSDDRLVTDMVNYNISLQQVIDAESELNADDAVEYEYALKVLIVQKVINQLGEKSMTSMQPRSPISQEFMDEIHMFVLGRGSFTTEHHRQTTLFGLLWEHPILDEIDWSGNPSVFVRALLAKLLSYDHSNPAAGINLLIQLLNGMRQTTGPDNQRVIDTITQRLTVIAKQQR